MALAAASVPRRRAVNVVLHLQLGDQLRHIFLRGVKAVPVLLSVGSVGLVVWGKSVQGRAFHMRAFG